MNSEPEDEYFLRLHQAARYLIKEHGVNAAAEAEAALRYANQINDSDTVDLFTEVLKQLADMQ